MEQIQQTEVEQIESDHTSPEISVSGSVAVAGAKALHSALDTMADAFDVSGFKCTECDLAHMHDTTKHRASDSFHMSDSDAASMDYNPNCHCGYNEAAHKGIADVDPDSAFRTAPIPDETQREMRQKFGAQ